MIEKIEDIFQLKYRRYLSMFRLRQDTSLTNTIFRAVFNSKNNNQTSLNQINQEIVFSSRGAKRATEVARTSCELELCGWGAWYVSTYWSILYYFWRDFLQLNVIFLHRLNKEKNTTHYYSNKRWKRIVHYLWIIFYANTTIHWKRLPLRNINAQVLAHSIIRLFANEKVLLRRRVECGKPIEWPFWRGK